jgi:predicted Holliday junction resolvase-like endonuclease
METLYFILGMLSVVTVVLTVVAVYGIVKYNQSQKQINNLQREIEETQRGVWRESESINRRIDRDDESKWRASEEIRRKMEELQSYIDSRVDKLDAKYTPKGVKQQING